jgi:hypothetical protein
MVITCGNRRTNWALVKIQLRSFAWKQMPAQKIGKLWKAKISVMYKLVMKSEAADK